MRAFATCALMGGTLAIGLQAQVKNMLQGDSNNVITGPIYLDHKDKAKGIECLNPGAKLQYNKHYKDFEPCDNC